MNEIELCAICLEDRNTKERVNLPCKHAYHSDCIIQYICYSIKQVSDIKIYNQIRRNLDVVLCKFQCPMCRKYIGKTNIQNLIETRRNVLMKESRSFYLELKKRQLKYMFTKLCIRNRSNGYKIELKENVEFIKCVYDVIYNKFKTVNELYKTLHEYEQM
jgi:hypothetical protein